MWRSKLESEVDMGAENPGVDLDLAETYIIKDGFGIDVLELNCIGRQFSDIDLNQETTQSMSPRSGVEVVLW